ncbi:hypothetical protein NEUTE2DRAFT_74544 [Neurospora tetrasperma FGSC 2509]|nr:hypothetical protein NEUTE2DRAFT_74544 [Neurospora tetrasperma FGSC 2509]
MRGGMNVEEGADYEQAGKHNSKNEGITRKCKRKTKQSKAKRTTNSTLTSGQDCIEVAGLRYDFGNAPSPAGGVRSRTLGSADPLIRVDGPAAKNSKVRRCCLPRAEFYHSSTALFSGSSAAVAGDIQSLTALGGTVQTVATVIWQNTIIKGPQMQVLGFWALEGQK